MTINLHICKICCTFVPDFEMQGRIAVLAHR